MNAEYFEIKVLDNILVFTMHAPGNNLMTGAFFVAWEEAVFEIQELLKQQKIEGIIIVGNGRQFSVGADVEALAERTKKETDQIEQEVPETHWKQKQSFTFWRYLQIPVVSVVNGFCMGSGCEIAINSHFRICEKNARIGQPESTFGILPALGGIASTVECCGLQKGIEMIFSGQLIPAKEAKEIGWADLLTDRRKGMETAKAFLTFLLRQEGTYDQKKKQEYLHAFQKEMAI